MSNKTATEIAKDLIAFDKLPWLRPSVPDHESYYKLLLYAGYPPREQLSMGIHKNSPYILWVMVTARGLRTLHPELPNENIYDEIVKFADWCRIQQKEYDDANQVSQAVILAED